MPFMPLPSRVIYHAVTCYAERHDFCFSHTRFASMPRCFTLTLPPFSLIRSIDISRCRHAFHFLLIYCAIADYIA